MKKLRTILVILVAALAIIFRFNILGFYHEYLKDEVLDLGGYGTEEIKSMTTDSDGNIYVLSITTFTQPNEYGYVDYAYRFLLTKLNSNHKKINSVLIDSDVLDDAEMYTATWGQVEVTEDNELIVMLDFIDYTEGSWEEKIYLLNLNQDLLIESEQNITENVDRVHQRFRIINDEIVLMNYDASLLYTFDKTTLSYKSENSMPLIQIGYLLDFSYKDNMYYVLGFNSVDNARNYYLVAYDPVARTRNILVEIEKASTSFDYELTNEYLIYAVNTGDPWFKETMDIYYVDFEDSSSITITCDLPTSDNKINGISLINEQLYLYGWEDADPYVDAAFYRFNMDGTYDGSFDSNIGGIDSVQQLYYYNEEIISIISSKRVVDFDYIRRYNSQYDQIIKFH